jgi:hypothetical protein
MIHCIEDLTRTLDKGARLCRSCKVSRRKVVKSLMKHLLRNGDGHDRKSVWLEIDLGMAIRKETNVT